MSPAFMPTSPDRLHPFDQLVHFVVKLQHPTNNSIFFIHEALVTHSFVVVFGYIHVVQTGFEILFLLVITRLLNIMRQSVCLRKDKVV
jgi:hypothetical protein